MPIRKIWDHAIEVKERFVPRKGKVYPLSREKREKMREFIQEQLRKRYIWPSKSSQIAPVFFVGKKDGKKRMVQDYCVVATTCQNSTRSLLTSAKLLIDYLVVGITRELDKEPSLHCFSIYINTLWSMLQ